MGLTLAEMKRVVMLAHDGTNPCPEIVQWLDGKDEAIEQQIHSLRTLQQRLRRCRRLCSTNDVETCAREKELCCLIADLLNSAALPSNRSQIRIRCSRLLYPRSRYQWHSLGRVRGRKASRQRASHRDGCVLHFRSRVGQTLRGKNLLRSGGCSGADARRTNFGRRVSLFHRSHRD